MCRRAVLAVAVSVALVGAACAGDGEDVSRDSRSVSATAEPGTVDGEAMGDRSAGAGEATEDGAQTTAPVVAALEPPRAGGYRYAATFDDGERATFSDRVSRSSAGSTEVTVESSSSRSSTTVTAVSRWESGRVLQLSRSVRIPGVGTFSCAYDPPIEILPAGPGEGTGEQTWEGDGCTGSLRVAVSEGGEVEAAGATWSTWSVEAQRTFRIRSDDGERVLEGRREEAVLFAPELGVEVRRQRRSEATIDGEDVRSEVVATLEHIPEGSR